MENIIHKKHQIQKFNFQDIVLLGKVNQIVNRYTADGRNLGTEYFTMLIPITLRINKNTTWTYSSGLVNQIGTVYIDNKEYNTFNGYSKLTKLQRVYNTEGFADTITATIPNYKYYRRDHLGNNREVWCANSNTTLQYTQYYPSGLPWAFNVGDNPGLQERKYNGKEFVEMHGYDTYDYGARGHYPAMGRFMSVDQLAELDCSISPYAYCHNNPINRIDPTGKVDILPDGAVVVTAPRLYDNYYTSPSVHFIDYVNRNTPQIPILTPPTTTFNLTTNPNENNVVINNKDSKKDNGTIETISTALSSVGIAADGAEIYTVNNAGKEIVYVTLKGTTAAVNATKVISVLKGISTATIVIGVVVDAVHVAVDPSYAGKAIVNTGVTVVATIIGATLSAPAGIVIGGGYLLLDQLGAFYRPTNIPYYNSPVCPQDNTKINVPYK